MQLQIHPKYHLGDQHEHEPCSKARMDVRSKLAASVSMTEEIADYCNDCAECLKGYVPARANNLREKGTVSGREKLQRGGAGAYT